MNHRGIYIMVIAAALTLTGCSSSSAPPEVAALCATLQAGGNPSQAVGAFPGVDADPVGALTRARDGIRTECPDQEPAAASLDGIIAQVGVPSDEESYDGAYSAEPAAPAVPRDLEYRVVGDGIKTAAVSWSAGGSNGGDTGKQLPLPWTRKVTAQPGANLLLSAVSTSGSTGSLRCVITDTATGQVVSEQSATAEGGGSSSYASVVCG